MWWLIDHCIHLAGKQGAGSNEVMPTLDTTASRIDRLRYLGIYSRRPSIGNILRSVAHFAYFLIRDYSRKHILNRSHLMQNLKSI